MNADRNELMLAVLIDADNAPRTKIKGIMEEVAVYGNPTVKRIYGDWTSPNMAGWKTSLLENAITPIQQYAYTYGKNSTDSAMIIDAMDILYSGQVDGFCIVSSDSDFTRLALRLREAGKWVLGIGEKKTPSPFIVACDKFLYTEIISRGENKKDDAHDHEPNPTAADQAGDRKKHQNKNGAKVPESTIALIASTINDMADDDGWAFLAEVGTLLLKKQPDFDPRNFGFTKLTPLIKSLDVFDIDVRETNFPHIKHIYIKNRK